MNRQTEYPIAFEFVEGKLYLYPNADYDTIAWTPNQHLDEIIQACVGAAKLTTNKATDIQDTMIISILHTAGNQWAVAVRSQVVIRSGRECNQWHYMVVTWDTITQLYDGCAAWLFLDGRLPAPANYSTKTKLAPRTLSIPSNKQERELQVLKIALENLGESLYFDLLHVIAQTNINSPLALLGFPQSIVPELCLAISLGVPHNLRHELTFTTRWSSDVEWKSRIVFTLPNTEPPDNVMQIYKSETDRKLWRHIPPLQPHPHVDTLQDRYRSGGVLGLHQAIYQSYQLPPVDPPPGPPTELPQDALSTFMKQIIDAAYRRKRKHLEQLIAPEAYKNLQIIFFSPDENLETIKKSLLSIGQKECHHSLSQFKLLTDALLAYRIDLVINTHNRSLKEAIEEVRQQLKEQRSLL